MALTSGCSEYSPQLSSERSKDEYGLSSGNFVPLVTLAGRTHISGITNPLFPSGEADGKGKSRVSLLVTYFGCNKDVITEANVNRQEVGRIVTEAFSAADKTIENAQVTNDIQCRQLTVTAPNEIVVDYSVEFGPVNIASFLPVVLKKEYLNTYAAQNGKLTVSFTPDSLTYLG